MQREQKSNLNKKRRHHSPDEADLLPPSTGTLKSLPIDQYKKEIVDMIEKNRVCVISGKTGCGKTTQVPWMLLEDAIIKEKL